MDEELEPWLACNAAFQVAQTRWVDHNGGKGLPPLPHIPPDFVCPLGQEPWDLWVYAQLCNAGVTVELLKSGGEEGEGLYQAMQIVDESDMESAFEEMNPMNIQLLRLV